MSTTHEGFSLLISFAQYARQSAWLRSRFAQAQKTVQEVLEEWKANPFCQASSSRTRVEVSIALAASEREAFEALLMALLHFATEKGAHAEFARFPLDGAVRCQVWDARKRQFVERPPDARDVKQDYTHVQKALRELVRIKAPKTAAPSAPALACPCGAPVKASASRCPSCQRSFVEPLAVKTAPGNAVAVRLARESLLERDIPSEGKDFGSFALVLPRNAREWLDARDVLTRSGFKLLDAAELDRRVKFLTDIASWPRKYPVGDAGNSLGDWAYSLLHTPSAGTRATLEKLGRAHPEALLALARGLPGLEPGWIAAAHLAGVHVDALTGSTAQAAFSLPLRLASPPGRGHELPVVEPLVTLKALVRLAPELLSAKERAAHLRELEREAVQREFQVGPWLDAVRRLEGLSLAEALQVALKKGTREDAQETAPGLFAIAEQTLDWAVDPSELPRLYPLEDAELRPALEELAQRGFPPALARRLRAASKATPPYGLELVQAWTFAPLKRAKPTLPCPECRAAMKPKAVFDIPELGAKLGPRTIHLYECDTCAAEEPTLEQVHITLAPGGRAKASAAESFLDAPDAEAASRASPPGFVRRTYARWLEESGRSEREGLQLGGHPHGHYPEDPLSRLSCRHSPTLLQFEPLALGMALSASRVATSVCLNPGCTRPSVAEPVTA